MVEARSLSALTSLASNPPAYPRNPTNRHESLVLYIARVPGSQDVFLTTMKPREKIVSAEDVRSSFYYLHFETPEDEVILKEAQSLQKEEKPTEKHQINRKPLPRSSSVRDKGRKLGNDGQNEDALKRTGLRSANSLRRKPITGRNESSNENIKPSQDQFLSPQTEPSAEPFYLPLLDTNPWATPDQDLPASSSSAHALPPPPPPRHQVVSTQNLQLHDFPPDVETRSQYSYTECSSVSIREESPVREKLQNFSISKNLQDVLSEQKYSGAGVSITLVRRDPGSGGQWNVGRISFDQDQLGRLTDPNPSKQLPRTINIEIYTRGYQKFMPRRNDVKIPMSATSEFRPSFQRSERASMDSTRTSSTTATGIFTRQVVMELPESRNPSRSHQKTLSNDSTCNYAAYGSDRLQTPISPSFSRPISPTGPSKSKPRGYSFTSLWDGQCNFVTSISGRSLKCKHQLPQAVAGETSSTAATISELRFNLPASALFSTAVRVSPKTHARQAEGHKSLDLGGFGLRRRRSGSSPSIFSHRTRGSSDNGDLDLLGLSLSLGQEHAGGGIGGKRAKLGKLIIEDEGLKMLDLIVAANMGIWWGVWDRNERNRPANTVKPKTNEVGPGSF